MNEVGDCPTVMGKCCGCNATQDASAYPFSLAATSHASASCVEGCKVCGSRYHLRDAVGAARVGECTISLDAVACHRVVVCGRIVRYIDAFSNGSAATASGAAASSALPTAMPYDLFWLSDTTGVVCVLRLRPTLAQGFTSLSALSCFCDGWPSVPVGDRCLDSLTSSAGGAALHPARASACAFLAGRSPCAPTPKERQSSTDARNGDAARKPSRYGTGGAATMKDFGLEREEDYAVSVNDYVVCVGSLAFADVDAQVRHALQPYTRDVRQATWAAAASSWSSFHLFSGGAASFIGADVDSGDAGCGACGTVGGDAAINERATAVGEPLGSAPVPPLRQEFVLLPGSEVPLTLDVAREKLGLVGSLPSSTRYLTAAEAAELGDTSSDHAVSSLGLLSSSASAFHDDNGERSSEAVAKCGTSTQFGAVTDMDGVPVLSIKGDPRLVLDTNECMFWWLSAAETHLRLRARASNPSMST
ncbi:hypothetical protein CUR178_02034 [Leishmania enriettii]|uniref:Uncharacterized protein n=1 Tax=Leishmania enriettii TaxID=5663 RepID=A0A836GLH3_LEIEN|nr:hypothetical protein CUR178_02034 [Leishmania enriettii]